MKRRVMDARNYRQNRLRLKHIEVNGRRKEDKWLLESFDLLAQNRIVSIPLVCGLSLTVVQTLLCMCLSSPTKSHTL